MARTVFILGAGASKHAGAPLMNQFLEKAWDLLETDKLAAADRCDFALVRKGVNALQIAHSKGDLDIWNLEAVFDAFEMAVLLGHLGDMPKEDIERLPEAMRQVILTTLQEQIRLPIEAGGGSRTLAATKPYARFVDAAASVEKTTGAYPAVITFNYDICLEWALYRRGIPWSDCVRAPGSGASLRLLKLHGSLNWAFCSSCRQVAESRDWGSIVEGAHDTAARAQDDGLQVTRLEVVSGAPTAPRCGCESSKRAVMVVPPTINKGQHHDMLSKVWAAAAAELRTAEDIFMCGYSLPEADMFFRYLYAVGTIGEASLRRVWVFNPDAGVKPRFSALLGKQVLSQRHRFLLFPVEFEKINWQAVLTGDLKALPNPV